MGALKYQVAHGFRRGQPVYSAPAPLIGYKLATIATGFDGVVGSINSPNQFELVTAGTLDNISGILSQGQSLYLSTVPGTYALTGDIPVLKGQSTSAANVQALAPPSVASGTTSTTSTAGFTSASNSGSGAPVFNASTSTASALKFKTLTASGAATITDMGASLDIYAPPASGGVTLPSYKATVLAEPGLISLWCFDDAFGTSSFADSKGTNTLAASGAIAGGGSALLSGAGTSLIMASGASSPAGANLSLPLGNDPRSVELWFRTLSTASAGLFHYGTPSFGAEDFSFGINANNSGAVQGLIGLSIGAFAPTFSPNVMVFDGAWHHAVVTFDGPASGTMNVWYDGVLVASSSGLTLGTIYNSSYPLSIGGSSAFYAGNAIGMIDEVALYGVALTPTQVRNHYYLGRASPTI